MKNTLNPYLIIIGLLFLFIFTTSLAHAAIGITKVRICAIKGTVKTGQSLGKTSGCLLTQAMDKTECRIFHRATYLETGPNGWAIVEFPNRHKIKVPPNTIINIHGTDIYVHIGKNFYKIEKGQDKFLIKTPTAIVGIRGTEFIVEVEDDGSSTIKLIEGMIEVTDITQQSRMNLTEGMQVSIAANSSALNPGILNIKESDQWWTDWPTLVPIDEDPLDEEPGLNTGGTKHLIPIADSHVYAYSYRGWNQANWGKYEVLGAGWNPTGGEKRTYLKFDVSGIDKASFENAKLRLYHYHSAGTDRVQLGVYPIRGPWNEGSGTYKPSNVAAPHEISWVNQPQFDPYPLATFNPGIQTNDFVDIDVTSLVGSWVNGMQNHGLVIKTVDSYLNGSESMYGFYAREHEDVDKRPQLIINDDARGGGLPALDINQTPPPLVHEVPPKNDYDFSGKIKVFSATYGGNCGAPRGNVTNHIARSCDGKTNCRYTVDYKVIGDAVPGCAKTYKVEYQCSGESVVREDSLSAEAGWGDRSVQLTCDSVREPTTGHVTGTWSLDQSNGYVGEMVLKQTSGGKLSGHINWGNNLKGTVSGSVSGSMVEFTIDYSWGKGFYKGTLNADKTQIVNGTTKSSTGETATWNAEIIRNP